jgi:hypothetical protein
MGEMKRIWCRKGRKGVEREKKTFPNKKATMRRKRRSGRKKSENEWIKGRRDEGIREEIKNSGKKAKMRMRM